MSGFLLDTNVPSESCWPQPEPKVAAWLKSQAKDAQFLSVVTVGEFRKGAALLPPGSKRRQIEQAIDVLIPAWFGDRILPVTQGVAEMLGHFGGSTSTKRSSTWRRRRDDRRDCD